MDDKHIYTPKTDKSLKGVFNGIKSYIKEYIKDADLQSGDEIKKPSSVSASTPTATHSPDKTKKSVKKEEKQKEISAEQPQPETKILKYNWSKYQSDNKLPEETKMKIITTMLLVGILVILAFSIYLAQRK